jgi:hypothetical protein
VADRSKRAKRNEKLNPRSMDARTAPAEAPQEFDVLVLGSGAPV